MDICLLEIVLELADIDCLRICHRLDKDSLGDIHRAHQDIDPLQLDD